MDYATMQAAIGHVNERASTLAGDDCPHATCFGTLYRRAGRLLCTGCTRTTDGRRPRRSTAGP